MNIPAQQHEQSPHEQGSTAAPFTDLLYVRMAVHTTGADPPSQEIHEHLSAPPRRGALDPRSRGASRRPIPRPDPAPPASPPPQETKIKPNIPLQEKFHRAILKGTLQNNGMKFLL